MKTFKFKIGSDPEFSFISQGRRINAKKLLNTVFESSDEYNNDGYETKGGFIGWDGCEATAELRPFPSKSTEQATKNIKIMLEEINERLPTFEMSTISTYAPVGGHIHIEIPEEIAESRIKLKTLHKRLTTFFLPIMISENKLNLRIRMNNDSDGYGSFTYHKESQEFPQKDGTIKRTYEFRIPSAEWLTTEKICKSTLTYIAVISNEIMHNQENFKKYERLILKNNQQLKAMQELAIAEYVGVTESLFKEIKKAVKTFELYKEYKEEIDYILNPKKVYEDKRKNNYKINKGWNLKQRKEKEVTLKKLTTKKEFKKRINEKTEEEIQRAVSIMNFTYNNDKNIKEMITELATRAFVFNWKLNKKYFIFGIRQGINHEIIFDTNNKLYKGEENIETQEDLKAMGELREKIIQKYKQTEEPFLDMERGEMKIADAIIIGLPYQDRIEKDINKLIKTIYKIEKNQIKEKQEINRKNLLNDTNLPKRKKGKVWKLINGWVDNEENEKKIEIDHTSQGARLAKNAIDSEKRMIRQSKQLEEEENNNRVTDRDLPLVNTMSSNTIINELNDYN